MERRTLPVLTDKASRLEFLAEALGETNKGPLPTYFVENRADRRARRRSAR